MHGGASQRAGEPDIDGACVCNNYFIHFKVEVKTPRGKVTPIQEFRLAAWSRLGYVTGTVTSVQEFWELIHSSTCITMNEKQQEYWINEFRGSPEEHGS